MLTFETTTAEFFTRQLLFGQPLKNLQR